jgi:hypothetical protein
MLLSAQAEQKRPWELVVRTRLSAPAGLRHQSVLVIQPLDDLMLIAWNGAARRRSRFWAQQKLPTRRTSHFRPYPMS